MLDSPAQSGTRGGGIQCSGAIGLVAGERFRHLSAADRSAVFVQVAGNRAIVVGQIQWRRSLSALLHDVGAAVRELTPVELIRRSDRRRRSGLELRFAAPAEVRVRQWDGVNEE